VTAIFVAPTHVSVILTAIGELQKDVVAANQQNLLNDQVAVEILQACLKIAGAFILRRTVIAGAQIVLASNGGQTNGNSSRYRQPAQCGGAWNRQPHSVDRKQGWLHIGLENAGVGTLPVEGRDGTLETHPLGDEMKYR